MKVMHYRDAETVKDIEGNGAHAVKGRLLIGKADGAPNFAMRMFELAEGGHTPCHSHDWEHEVFVHSGRGEALCDGDWVPVEAGSVVFVPGNAEHQFRNTGTEPFQFVCLVPPSSPEL